MRYIGQKTIFQLHKKIGRLRDDRLLAHTHSLRVSRIVRSTSLAGRSGSSWRLVAGCVVVGLLVLWSCPGGEYLVVAFFLLGLMLLCAALSAALASPGARQDAALCTLIGLFWAYAVGFAQYWSTAQWFYWVDTFIISVACLFAQARVCRKRSLAWLLACSVLLVPPIMASGVLGALVRGVVDDPRS